MKIHQLVNSGPFLKPFPDTVKSATNSDVFLALFEPTGRIPCLQATDIVLYFYVN